MKYRFIPLAFFAAAALVAGRNVAHAQKTDGRVTYTVQTLNYNGSYDPNNVSVVWVVDGNGKFVKTLCRHANARINYLYKWIADRGSYTAVDGVTSATLTSQPQTHTVAWDCRGTNGQVAADGTYHFRVEYTSSNAQGPYMPSNCPFFKGPGAFTTNFVAYANASGVFTNLTLTYTPYNEVAVTGLSPSFGVVNSNVTIAVSVTNQTLNSLSFNVALSNVTSGTLISVLPVTALPAQALTNLAATWSTAGLPQGVYQVRAVASRLATETNAANNVFTGNITLSSATAGDLAVTGFSPAEGIAGSPLPLRITVTNKTDALAGNFEVSLSNLTSAVSSVTESNAWRVASSSDDAEENVSTHAVSLTSTDLELVVDTAAQAVGIRFQNLAIPAAATIQSASIQFTDKTGENLNTDPISLTVRGQAADTAPTFSSGAANLSSRAETAASVTWVPPTWNDADAGPAQRTPDLKDIVQEIVSRPGWSSGNAMVFKITGSGSRRAWSYDGSSANAPQLAVRWSTPSKRIGSQQVASLAGLASTNLTFTWDTSAVTAGVYRLVAQAGPLASETFLEDNTLARTVTLREALHDLAVLALSAPATVPPNVLTNISVSVTNRGDVSETFTHTLRDVSGTPVTIGTRVVTNLAAYAGTHLTFVWNTATNATFKLGYHTLQAEISPVLGETDLSNNTALAQVVISAGLTTNTLVSKTAVWKYLDSGLDITGAPWKSADYYDGLWASGEAPLGYGLPSVATVIGYGGTPSNRTATTYFRHAFTVDFAPLALTGRMMRAHGAILYVNGVEIARQNMPPGPVGHQTLSSGPVSGASATEFFAFQVPSNVLAVGRNLLTAELHLAAVTNTTAGFAVELSSVTPSTPSSPAMSPSALEPDGPAQSGDAAGVTVTLANTGNVTASGLVLIRDAATGAILGTQTVGPLVPGETAAVRIILSTFGAATGSRTLQALTVVNGVTNLAAVATAPFTLEAPAFQPRTVNAAGSIGGRCNAVAASGSTVYLGCGSTLEAWNVQDPANPVRTALLRLPGVVVDLAASNSWVYAATGVAGVQIVQAPSATQLLHRATYDTSGFARRLALAGSLLYIADTLGGVRVLDVASPASPSLAGAYATTGPAQALAYAAPRLLVLDGQKGLQNLHAASPSALSATGAFSRVTAGLALAPVPGAVLLSDANANLFRVSTAVPTNLNATATALLPSAARSLAASGSALYAAAGAQGVLTLDATTLAQQVASGVGDEASDVAVSGNTLYVAAGFAGALAFDITSPLAPQPIGLFPTGARPVDAAAYGSTLYVAADEGGLQIHRLQQLGLPTRLGVLPSVENARCVAVAYPLLFVAEGLSGLKIYDITTPVSPVLRGSYAADGLSHIRRLAVAGNRVALTDGRTVHLVSVANASGPVLLAAQEPGGFVFDLAAIPGEVYAACGSAGVKILSMDALGLDNAVLTPGSATAVTLSSNLLTVACGPAGWLTLNIDHPATPTLVSATPGIFTFDAVASGKLVALADGGYVADVMSLSAPLTPVLSNSFVNLTSAMRVRAASGLVLSAEDEAGLAILNASPGDINMNGVPDEWEQQIVTASSQTNGPLHSVLDIDIQTVGPNGFTYYQSYLAGLTPTDPNSVLAIRAVSPPAGTSNQMTVSWHSVAGKRYTLYKSVDLAAGFSPIPAATGIAATGALTSFTDTLTGPRAFYMVVLAP